MAKDLSRTGRHEIVDIGCIQRRHVVCWVASNEDACIRSTEGSANAVSRRRLLRSSGAVFGKLSPHSPNALFGFVTIHWWYHVVPIVVVDGAPEVIDPAIEPSRPLGLKEWILRMVDNVADVKLAICSAHTYDPFDSCHAATAADEATALTDQRSFLGPEWSRQVSLGRDPWRVLGAYPPWLADGGAPDAP